MTKGLGPLRHFPPMALVGAAESVSLTGGLDEIFVDTRIEKIASWLDYFAATVKNGNFSASSLLSRIHGASALPHGVKRDLIALSNALLLFEDSQDQRKEEIQTFCLAQSRALRSTAAFDMWSKRLVRETKLCFSTISSAGRSVLSESGRFDVVIVDEATQAPEADSNILSLVQFDRVALVGDPNQLCGTVVSTEARRAGFDRSLFERALLAGHPTLVLDTQYRMHEEIAAFSNSEFYGGSLKTPVDRDPLFSTHSLNPLVFLDISGAEGTLGNGTGESISNLAEGQVVCELVRNLVQSGRIDPEAIGIITPYTAQTKLVAALLRKELGDQISSSVEVNSVDGFQGREKDVIILSLVRSNSTGQVGFVQDSRRLNVSLTRAKYSTLIVGSHSTLLLSDSRGSLNHFAKFIQKKYLIRLSHLEFVRELSPVISRAVFKSPPDLSSSAPKSSVSNEKLDVRTSAPANAGRDTTQQSRGGRGGASESARSSRAGRGRGRGRGRGAGRENYK